MDNPRLRLARALSTIENRAEGWRPLVASAYARAARAPVIGVTGPPGSGKSTLIDALAAAWAASGQRVAVLATDPSSPFSGGAVLGDRVRMKRSENLDGVFIRSLSARGTPGGLSRAVPDCCAVLSDYGYHKIIVETVGIGQSEVDIAFLADCLVVLAVPGLGDALQAAKAGIMEVGDIYVVNKADLPGADAVRQDVVANLALSHSGRPGANAAGQAAVGVAGSPGRMRINERQGDAGEEPFWHPPVLTLSNQSDEQGVAALKQTIEAFLAWADNSPAGDRRQREQAAWLLRQTLVRQVLDNLAAERRLDAWICRMAREGLDPHSAAERLLAESPGLRESGLRGSGLGGKETGQ